MMTCGISMDIHALMRIVPELQPPVFFINTAL